MKKREFLKTLMAAFAPAGALFGGGWYSLRALVTERRKIIIRPPGAVAEDEFLGKCIRCRRCGQVCPNETIQYFDGLDPVFSGTPHGVCVFACPYDGVAIYAESWEQPVVTDKCVGCGLCEQVCIHYPQAIRVVPYSEVTTT